MSAIAMAMLLATAEPTDAVLASGDMLPIASEKLSDCIVYNAVHADDGMSDVADLVAAARIKCAIKLGMWRYFTRAFASASSKPVDADAVTAGAERMFFETVSAKVLVLVEAGRNN